MSELFKRRWTKFKEFRRAYVSVWILAILFFFGFSAELWVNGKPLLLFFEGHTYFPALKYYPGATFGEEIATEVNYKELIITPRFKEGSNWILFAPIRWGPNESRSLETPPPHRPSRENWLGTDDRGRDVVARLLYGFRTSFLFAIPSWLLISFVAYVVGGGQGYFAGRVDLIGQRLVEIWNSLPVLYIIIFLMSVFQSSLFLLVVVWVVFGWIGLSGYVRAEVLKIRKLEFISAARALGAGHTRILFRHVLPNSLTPLITYAPFIISSSIGSLAALDYLGLGLPPPTPSWGELLRQGKENLSSWWLSFFPFFALFCTLLMLNFIGEGFRHAFDERG